MAKTAVPTGLPKGGPLNNMGPDRICEVAGCRPFCLLLIYHLCLQSPDFLVKSVVVITMKMFALTAEFHDFQCEIKMLVLYGGPNAEMSGQRITVALGSTSVNTVFCHKMAHGP